MGTDWGNRNRTGRSGLCLKSQNVVPYLVLPFEKTIYIINLLHPICQKCLTWVKSVNRHSTVTHYQRPTVTQLQEGGTGGEVSEILFFSAKSKRRPSLIYSMQIIPVCLSIVARRKGVSATRRGGLNWTPISLLVGHPCKLFHIKRDCFMLILGHCLPGRAFCPSRPGRSMSQTRERIKSARSALSATCQFYRYSKSDWNRLQS